MTSNHISTDQATEQVDSPSAPASEATSHGHIVNDPAVHGVVTSEHHFTPQPQDEIFSETVTFKSLGLRDSVLKGIEACGFNKPTGIQATLIPVALTGKDILGQAKTGTGKTAAFGLPLLHMCDKDTPFQALVLAPTRELAIQITAEINELGKFTPIRAVTVYGGQRIHSQAEKLAKGPQIIVATPGRVIDMVERGHLNFASVKCCVLDEVDRMLDIGFREDIRRVLKMTPERRQTIFVSATISPDIERLARQYMHEPEKLVVASGSLTVSLVKQYHLPVQPWDKKKLLAHLLKHEQPALTLVFCRMKRTVDEVARYLSKHGIDAHAIHADLSQSKRNSVMEQLRSGKMEVLIASDLASRGIDVDGISHVVNYDLPDDIELYVHRIGRTARAGRGGIAWAFVTPEQGGLLTDIEMLINAEIPKLEYPDFQPGPLPDDRRAEMEADRQRRANQTTRSRFTAATPDLPAGPAEAPAPSQSAAPQAPSRTAAPPQGADASKFPGGIVPTKLPPRRMHGKMPSGRGR
jgi:ATP-dependent RNA helicase DeaD